MSSSEHQRLRLSNRGTIKNSHTMIGVGLVQFVYKKIATRGFMLLWMPLGLVLKLKHTTLLILVVFSSKIQNVMYSILCVSTRGTSKMIRRGHRMH